MEAPATIDPKSIPHPRRSITTAAVRHTSTGAAITHRHHAITRRRVITSRRPVTIRPGQGRATVPIPVRDGGIIGATTAMVAAMDVAVIMAGDVAGIGSQTFL
ncbi:hypothetical protein A2T76_18765 [Pseudomonas brenneri]|nr:hypothetical protein A2T76_18765 [Pseudomonas brenneri]